MVIDFQGIPALVRLKTGRKVFSHTSGPYVLLGKTRYLGHVELYAVSEEFVSAVQQASGASAESAPGSIRRGLRGSRVPTLATEEDGSVVFSGVGPVLSSFTWCSFQHLPPQSRIEAHEPS